MENNTNKDGKTDANNPSQNASGERNAINPFRDAGTDRETEPSVEEEASLEQQRKEALTERD